MGAIHLDLSRPRSRVRWALVALLALMVLLLASGIGRAELLGSPGMVTEAGCDIAVELEGPIARITETHRLAANDGHAALAVYGAALSRGAIVDGLTVRMAGRDEPGVLVPRESLDNLTPPSLGLAPDLGTLRVGVDQGHPVIEVRVYPVAPSKVTGFTVRWSVPASYADGTMTVVLPARGRGDNLGRCRVKLDARSGGGVRGWASLRAGGVWVGAGARVRGTVSGASAAEAFAIEGRPTWATAAPVVAAAHAVLAPSGVAAADADAAERLPATAVASTIAIYVPEQPVRARFAPARLLFVVDTSRSVGDDGHRAAAEVIETLGRAAPAGTPVEAVLFDRRARRVLGTWMAGDGGGLPRLVRAVREAPAASGTDLGEALNLATAALGGEPGHVVIITDGVLPTGHTATELLGHFTAPAGRVVVDVLVPLTGGAAAPERGALEAITQVYGGRVVAFAADRPMSAEALADGLIAGLPIDQLALDADGAALDLELPDVLAAGSGTVLTTVLPRRPRRLELRARRNTVALTVRAIALPAGAERFAVAELAGHSGAETEASDGALARRHGIVGPHTAMLVIDRRSAGGGDRHALARRTGAITYTPSPEMIATAEAAAPVRIVADPRVARVGELPRTSVQRALREQLVPRMRVCYRNALPAAPGLGGELVIDLEIARGEVMAVSLAGDHFPEALIGCVADAAFAMTTPTYELGGVPDTVFVIRKPVTFRAPATSADEPTVSLDDVLYPATNPVARPAVEVEPDVPL